MAIASKVRRRKLVEAPKIKARRGRPPKLVSGDATSGAGLLTRVETLVATTRDLKDQNARLSREIAALKILLGKIERALRDNPLAVSSTTPASQPAANGFDSKPAAAKRPRRASTDPATQAKRQAALAKARAALAAKRAAARA